MDLFEEIAKIRDRAVVRPDDARGVRCPDPRSWSVNIAMHRLSIASRVELTRIGIRQAGKRTGRNTDVDDVEGPGRDDPEPAWDLSPRLGPKDEQGRC
jgi:hypothetical protein